MSLLRSSSEQHCNSTKNTTDCHIMYVEPFNVLLNTSNSQYDHKMSAHVLLKSDKNYLLQTNRTGYTLTTYNNTIMISNFRSVLNIVCVLLGISPASYCDLPTFRNPL
jgi:hypothetical protein